MFFSYVEGQEKKGYVKWLCDSVRKEAPDTSNISK